MDWSQIARDDDDHASVALANQILRSPTGAVVHGDGMAVIDMDIQTGVYVDPRMDTLDRLPYRRDYITRIRREEAGLLRPEGLSRRVTTMTLLSPGETVRPHRDRRIRWKDHVTLGLYSLRRYVEMSTSGNPTMLVPLFAPEESLIVITELGRELRAMRASFLSLQTVEQFLYYLDRVVGFLQGGSERQAPDVAELVAGYGWDVASGSRAWCLAYQVREIASTGHLTLPLPAEQRRRLLAINRGQVPRDEVLAEISACEGETRDLVASGRTPLPPSAPVDAILEWAAGAEARYRRGDVQGA